MTITLNLPEDVVQHLASHGADPARAALEAVALEGYRSRSLSEEQVRRMLGFESRFDVHAFLKQHGVYLNYTKEDMEEDLGKPIS
jgi:hypothetical protein